MIESTLQLGNVLIDKIEDFKRKSQNPALINAGDFDLDMDHSSETFQLNTNNDTSFRSSANL